MPSSSNSSTHANLFSSSSSLCLQLVKTSSRRPPFSFLRPPLTLVPCDTFYRKQNRSFLESDDTFFLRPNWERRAFKDGKMRKQGWESQTLLNKPVVEQGFKKKKDCTLLQKVNSNQQRAATLNTKQNNSCFCVIFSLFPR